MEHQLSSPHHALSSLEAPTQLFHSQTTLTQHLSYFGEMKSKLKVQILFPLTRPLMYLFTRDESKCNPSCTNQPQLRSHMSTRDVVCRYILLMKGVV